MGNVIPFVSVLSRRGLRVALLVVGIIAIGVWGNLLGYSPQLVPASSAESSQMISAFYTLGRLAVALLFVAAAPVLQRHAGGVGLVFGVAMAPATLLICLSSATQGTPVGSALLSPSVQLPVNALLAGMGFLAVSVPLFVELARLVDPRRAAAFAMVGILGECLVTSLLNSFASADAQLFACLVCPTLAGACLFVCTRVSEAGAAVGDGLTSGEGQQARRAGERGRATGMLAAFEQRDSLGSVLMVVQLAFAMVLASTLRSLSDMGPWGLSHQGYLGSTTLTGFSLAVTCGIVFAATLVVYVVPRRLPGQVRSAVALVVVFCGLQVATARFSGAPEGLVAGAVMGCQLFSRVIIWVTFMECVRQLRMQPLRVNGITCLFNVAGTVACAWVLGAGIAPSDLAMGLVATLLSVTVVAIALPFAGRGGLHVGVSAGAGEGAGANARAIAGDGTAAGEAARAGDEHTGGVSGTARTNGSAADQKDEPPSVERPSADSAISQAEATPAPLHAFACAYGVSPREEQVLGLLLDGCTRGQIERLLGLSEGTIRTHVNAVYRKLDVHSKADAHQLYDDWVDAHAEGC